jgi:hypothetical protein
MYQQEKIWCAEEINSHQTCLQENQLKIACLSKKRNNKKTRDLKTCNGGGFLPLCVITNVVTPRRDMLGIK